MIVGHSFNPCSIHRNSPLPVRRPSNPCKDNKSSNNRLSMAVRAQQRNSPRGTNGDRSKPSKAKEKKETKEEPAAKTKDDKVNYSLLFTVLFVTKARKSSWKSVLLQQLVLLRKMEFKVFFRQNINFIFQFILCKAAF